ncbi:phage tail tape measure protein [Aminipila sp.]|uniref:phage tail tape measure protein n=1 Tax=Aminipila sp. TaxID=2060095 RepID=UPI00289935DF|nr:phage tail tape measure protein [Aminipila sp.]
MEAGIRLAPLLTEIRVDINGFRNQMSRAAVEGRNEAERISEGLSNVTKVGDKLSSVGGTLIKSVTLPLAGAGIAAGKMAIDFESSFAKVSTLLDSSVVDYGKYKNDLLDASTESKVAVDEFSEAVYGSISAGVDQTKAIQFTTDAMKLAKGGFTDGAKAVDVMTTAINGYGLKAEDASKISDMLITTQNLGKTTVDELASSMGAVIPVASSVNFGMEELSASYAQLTKNGIATAESGTYLKSMLSELGKSGSITDKTLRSLTGKGFADLKKEGKSTSEILMLLKETAEKDGKTLKDMFGSVEAGSAALVLAKGDGEEYNGMLSAMQDSAGATQDAFDKMDATPAQKLSGAMNSLKNSAIKLGVELIPIATKAAEVISKLADKLAGLSDEQKENIVKWAGIALVAGPVLKMVGGGISTFVKFKSILGGTSTALSLLGGGMGTATTAASGLGTAAGVAGGATGLGGIAAGLGSAAIAAAPFALAIAGVGVTAYAVHKELSKEVIPTVDLFADKVEYASGTVNTGMGSMATSVQTSVTKISDATKTAVQSYVDMDDEVTKALYSQEVNQTVITDKIASDMVSKFTSMGTSIKDAEQKNYEERLGNLNKYFTDSSALSETRESEVLQFITTKHEERQKIIDDATSRITQIYANAKEEHRKITEQEMEEIESLQSQMRDNAITQLSSTEEEAAVIRQRMKDYQGRLTAEMAAEMITNANKARDGEIKAAEKKYDETIKQAARLKEAGAITEKEYEAMVTEAKKTKDDQVKAAKDACKGVKDEIKKATPGIEKEVNTQTGKIKTSYDKLKEGLGGFFSWLFGQNKEAEKATKRLETTNTVINESAATGLEYVPFDGYVTELHKGERVLTASENKAYNRGSQSGGDTYIFNSPKALTPAESARQMVKAKREMLLDF